MTPTILNHRYRIIRSLGRGGFGETFLAEDTHMPSGRCCVIKLLNPIANNPQVYQIVQERFKREAAILEELGHGNSQIPQLYAYFELGGQFYLVQEWIEGETLTGKIKQQGTLKEDIVKDILVKLLSVLDYVHSKHIVHRDIKPDNIILRNSDSMPVLIDFGAVKETMGTVVKASGNPTGSIVIGTPGFMASEQAMGRPVYSSDLYALGLTAIYLLTGKVPQDLETEYQTGEIIWRRHALNISPTLATVLDKAIQSHVRDRYSSAREMLNALQSPLASLPRTITETQLPPASIQQKILYPSPQEVSPHPVSTPTYSMGGCI
ncbi:MAG: serine/threonine protein kinase, partial [Moorea sp. SIO2B7]|nr:serine/threonine protein kinase [Moorena sp. SIO2B7]